MLKPLIALRIILVLSAPLLRSAETPRFLASDYVANKVCIVSKEGAIEWEFPASNSCDVWRLSNGNILFSTRDGAREVSPDKKVVWEYKTEKGNEVYTCQRLPNGDTLIGELGACRLIEVGADGTVHKTIPVPVKGKVHLQFRNARKLDNGHYLVACTAEHTVKEIDSEGKVVIQFPITGDPFCAVRLPNGNTLIACGDGHTLVELDAAGKVIWQITETELPGITLRFVAGVQRLPNGNTVVCNWLGHGHIGDGVHLFEITPDKKVVWQFADHRLFKTISSIQMLDVPGEVTKNEIKK